MGRNSGKQDTGPDSKTKGGLETDVDALYQLPFAEFTAGRNALAARLKQGGRRNEADFVKTLAKPSVSAWAVNQLYWQHREAFDRLLATGEHFRQVQTSGRAVKAAEMREALDARREALVHVSDLATSLLRAAGHNPTPETIWRVSTTLEAMSAYASIPNGPTPGRLTHDLDPPGFDTLASLIPSGATPRIEEKARATQPTQSTESARAATSARRKADTSVDVNAAAIAARRLEETRQAKVTAAKVALQEAKSLLTEARARAQSLESAQKKANAEAKAAEQQTREAKQRFEKARAASEEATQQAQSITAELKESAQALEDAKRTVEKLSQELERLFRESPAR